MSALQLLKDEATFGVDYEMEIAVLGSVLILPDAIGTLSLSLKPEHFSLPANQTVFAAMLAVHDAGRPANLRFVHDELVEGGDTAFGQTPAIGYLNSLWRIENNSVYVYDYAKRVIELAKERRLSDIQRAIGNARIDELDDLRDQLQDAMREEKNQTELVSLDTGLKAQNERLDRQLAGEPAPRWTGFYSLDRRMMRWEPGDLIVLAGLTGRGKTAFGLNVAYHLLKNERKRVCFFSLEMSEIQIADRLVALDSGIPVTQIQDGEFSPSEMDRYAISQGRLSGMAIRMSHDPAITVQDIRRKIEREHRLNPFDLVIVDYLGLMTGDGENRTQEVSKLVKGLKALAVDLHAPILTLHQLNRGADETRRPRASDLLDSSVIEHTANTIILLWHDPQQENAVEVIVEKNRQREKGTVQMHWNGPLMKFSDLEYRYGG